MILKPILSEIIVLWVLCALELKNYLDVDVTVRFLMGSMAMGLNHFGARGQFFDCLHALLICEPKVS